MLNLQKVQEIKEYMEEVKWNEINSEIDESIRLQEKLSAISVTTYG